MRPRFTESTFAFAFTQELVKKLNLLTVPEFISQQAEKLKGYDVKFHWKEPIFIQFKISDYLYGPTSSERRLFKTEPYFRFKLHQDRRNKIVYNQHNLLCKLNKSNRHVYYCAPIFHKKSELNKYFQNSNLSDNSVLFKPNQMGNVWRQSKHRVVYNRDLSFCYFLSRPKKIEYYKLPIMDQREEIILNRKFWLNILKEVKNKITLQIEDNRPKTKEIDYKSVEDSSNLPVTYQEVDYSYDFEQKKRKIQELINELKEYDYPIMLKEIETFLEKELDIHIVL